MQGKYEEEENLEEASGKGWGFYLYGIIPCGSKESFGPLGVGQPPSLVFTMPYQDIAMVVSKSQDLEPKATRRNVFAHRAVLSKLMELYTVIPVSFGTVLGMEQDVIEVLRGGYESFKSILQYLDGKMEVGLEVAWKKESFSRELQNIGQTLPSLKELRQRQRTSPDKSLRTVIDAGELVAETLSTRSAIYAREICEALRSHAVAFRLNEPRGERMILNAAFLVEKVRETEFDEVVNDVASRFEEQFEFNYTGPWPPYNFVDIKLKAR